MVSPPHHQATIAVVGGGPAGLRAAEVAAMGGAAVTLYDAMPSVGRKFLVAGKSGLNLTNAEPIEPFLTRYTTPGLDPAAWRRLIEAFDNTALRAWAAELGITTHESAGGKVFPRPMKAAPLLRAWVRRLRELGVGFAVHHRLTHLGLGPALAFDSPTGAVSTMPNAVILALGGASWPRTGSRGTWPALLATHGIRISPLTPANCGWETAWPQKLLAEAEGLPLKNITVRYGGETAHGDLVITRYGLEGAPIYRLGPGLRNAVSERTITLDLKPDFSVEVVTARLAPVRRNYIREAGRRLNLSPAAAALLKHLPNIGPWDSPAILAAAIKACPIPLTRPRPLTEAISTAGGVPWPELTSAMMLEKLPGVFVAGEMVDWEAPTGGYLLQACFATGTRAADGALHYVNPPVKKAHT